ncbi:MAG: hypothetical protein ABIV47_00130 [Roseiflexaceae bacterium]
MDDMFTRYERALERLLEQLGQLHSMYPNALTFQQRLSENIGEARRYGDTQDCKATRARVIEQLNRLALDAIGFSFNDLTEAYDERARQRAHAAGAVYAGAGRVEDEAKVYSATGGTHSGSGAVYFDYYGANHPNGKGYSIERVLQLSLDKVLAVYVPPLTHAEAQRRIGTNHVLVLGGQVHGVGKYSAALHLLADVGNTELFQVSSNIDLEDAKAFTFQKATGYIIENLALDRARALNGTLLQRLAAQLKDLHSHLIITVHANTPLDIDALEGYGLRWEQPLKSDQVLDKHIKWYISNAIERNQAFSFCYDADVQKAYQGQPPAQIDRLAQLLAEAARGQITLAQALEQFAFNARKQVLEWFDQHPDLDQRTRLLAVAVFHRGHYERAMAADKQLQELIKPPSPANIPLPLPPIFEQTSTAKLKEAGARIERKPERIGADTSIVERVFLENPALQPVIVQYVWDEFVGLRSMLLKWLTDLGKSDDAETREYAAAAIGELAKHDFSAIYTGIIEPSASDDDARARILAAVALGILATREELAPQILARLHEWSMSSYRWPRWTATLAYGLFVGREYPADALWDLYAIMRTPDSTILTMVRNSIVDIFAIGKQAPTYYFRVLEALDIWVSDSSSSGLQVIWLNIFMQLAQHAKHPLPTRAAQPTLLWIYTENSAYQATIRRLIRMALNTQVPRCEALKALHGWLCAADGQPEIYPTLEQFIRDLINEATAIEQDRLRYWFARWSRDLKRPCQSAARLAGL